MTLEEKIYDLPRLRWITAVLIVVFTPFLAILIHKTTETTVKAFSCNSSWWLVWVAASAYSILLVIVYNVTLDTSSRKDALIPTKRHSHVLLLFIPPIAVIHELFLSNDALRYLVAVE